MSVRSYQQRPFQLLALAALNADDLRHSVAVCRSHLAKKQVTAGLTDISASQPVAPHRLAAVVTSPTMAQDQLQEYFRGDGDAVVAGVATSRPALAFLFTGHGAQYAGMGTTLYESSPLFRQTIDRCDVALRPYLDQSLLDILTDSGDMALLETMTYAQPALFAVELALAELWRAWGVAPTAVMGHSLGEYVAAVVAGVFSLEDGLKLVAARGRLMDSLNEAGEMAAVFASEAEVAAVLAPFADEVSIAGINGPKSVVISGAQTAVQAVLAALKERRVRSRRLDVAQAAHSPLLDPILDEFEAIAATVTYRDPQLRLISTVTGQAAVPAEITQPSYWRRHLRQAVRFADALQTLALQGYDLFLEIGPQPTLSSMGRRCLPADSATWLPSLVKGEDEWQRLLGTLAELYVRGVDPNWRGLAD